jgi:adenylosuccinate lyase
MKYRVIVEIEYLLFLSDKKIFTIPAKAKVHLKEVMENFGPEQAAEIKGNRENHQS